MSLREEAQRSGLCHVFNKQEGWAQLWQQALLQQSFQCRSYSAFLAFNDYIWPHMKFPPEPTELCRVCSCGSQAVCVEVMKHFKTFHCCQMLKSTSWSGVNVVFMFSLPGLSVLFSFLLTAGLLPMGVSPLCVSLVSLWFFGRVHTLNLHRHVCSPNNPED